MTNSDYEIPKNCDFSEVENNSTSEFTCTPKLLDPLFTPFRGIIINAPQSITWPENGDPGEMMVTPNGNSNGPYKLMVSGYFILDIDTGETSIELAKRVIVVAVNQKTAQTYSGRMEIMGFQVSPFEQSTRSLAPTTETVSSSFNIDLFQNLNIPVAAATYTLYATLDAHKSNILSVEVILN